MTTIAQTDFTRRDSYNSLVNHPDWCRELIIAAESQGVFSSGIESDRKGRGSSINVELVGHDAAEGLAVIQVRQCIFHPRRFNRVRKDYYLIGRTETGNVFAHPIDSPLRKRSALVSPEATVAYVLSQIWDCKMDELAHIVRQGDIAFIPSTLPQGSELTDNCVVLRETHKITGEIFKSPAGILYVQRARAVHTKGQHATIKVKDSWYRIQEGIRASVWGFTRPVGD